MNFELWAIPFVLISGFFNSFGSFLLKKTSIDATKNIFKLFLNPKFLFAVSVLFLGAVFFIISLRGGPLTIMYPLISTSYLWSCFFAIKYLNEQMNTLKWIGVFTTIFGIILISMS